MPNSDTKPNSQQLGRLLQQHRHAAGLSLERLADATSLDKGTISRMEQGQIEAPSPKNLQRLATALGTEVEDYFALAGYFTPHGLPGLAPYLRAKYDVSPELASEVEDFLTWRLQKQGRDATKER